MADDPQEPADTVEPELADDADAPVAADDATGSTTDDDPAAESATDTDDPSDEAESADAASDTEAATAAAAKPEPKVVRKKVTSKRVTPKGATQGVKARSSSPSGKRAVIEDDDDEPGFSKRYTPPKATYAPGPSPWWVPALMFGLLIVGALVIMLNYMGAFGEAENIRLVIGLAFILGGIITATQYR